MDIIDSCEYDADNYEYHEYHDYESSIETHDADTNVGLFMFASTLFLIWITSQVAKAIIY